MKVTKVDAKTVTEVRVVEPEKVLIELTLEEAKALKFMHGAMCSSNKPVGKVSCEFYEHLNSIIPGYDKGSPFDGAVHIKD
jgi:hypothetical protein